MLLTERSTASPERLASLVSQLQRVQQPRGQDEGLLAYSSCLGLACLLQTRWIGQASLSSFPAKSCVFASRLADLTPENLHERLCRMTALARADGDTGPGWIHGVVVLYLIDRAPKRRSVLNLLRTITSSVSFCIAVFLL